MKVTLTGVPETLLIPFYARVYGSKHYPEKFYDATAMDIFQKLDYDFSKFEKGKMSIWGTLARSILLDRVSKDFLEKHPEAVCITIGCGFDTRFERIDNGSLEWYGVDFPEVIHLRKQFFPEKERTHWIAKSAFDSSWTSEILKKREEDVFIILEGLLMYFTEKEVQSLFQMLRTYFPKATILAEFMKPFTVKHQKHHDTISKTEAVFQWGIQNAKEIEVLCPGVQFVEEWNLTKEMLPFSPWKLALLSPLLNRVNDSIVKMKLGEY